MDWKQIFKKQENESYYIKLNEALDEAYQQKVVYPKREDLYRAFDLCSYKDVKLVIIGQDPYHGEDQANGLSFSVSKGVAHPPSLRNIFKELESDLGVKRDEGDLSSWAEQGVLLLNKIMSVEAASPASHAQIGWDEFTNEIILSLNDHPDQIIYLLWGNYARKLKPLIAERHLIIEGVHPSPLAAYRGFFGSKPFSTINEHLVLNQRGPIDWSK